MFESEIRFKIKKLMIKKVRIRQIWVFSSIESGPKKHQKNAKIRVRVYRTISNES